jgi:hypothetical protein
MSEYEYDDEETFADEPKQNPLRQALKQKDKEAAELKKLLADAEQAKRELAFMKAGINPDDAAAKYFVKAYDGELSPEAIQQAATEARLISTPSTNADEAAAWKRTTQVADGSGTAQPPVDWNKRINEATSQAEVEAILAEARDYL